MKKSHNVNKFYNTIDKFLDTKECPNCGKLIDSIIVGEEGIRCEFCKNKNILEQLSLASKLEDSSVRIQDFVTSVSEFYEAEKEGDKIINSPAFKFHISEDLIPDGLDSFLKEYIGIFVFCKRNTAKLFIPEANVVTTEAKIQIGKEKENVSE
jgi:translation initiation factor 2 beta subunit (eIF-2beta)/eIF-5